MVHLAYEESRRDVETQMEYRSIRGRYGNSFECFVRTVIGRLRGAGIEKHCEEYAGDYQQQKRIERYFAEHERPVIGEHVIQRTTKKSLDVAARQATRRSSKPPKSGDPAFRRSRQPARRFPSSSA